VPGHAGHIPQIEKRNLKMMIATILPLLKSGAQLQINLQLFGDEVQLDLVPRAGENKSGISIPARSFVGKAEELDTQLIELLQAYIKPATSIQEQIQQATQEMANAAAKAEENRKAKSASASSKPGAAKSPVKGPAAKPVPTLMEDDDGQEADDGSKLVSSGEPPTGGSAETESELDAFANFDSVE
jgi:PRTRC genetic system protein E